jgi:hypothetical protein
VTGRLKAAEDYTETMTMTPGGKLLLTEEWVAHMRERQIGEGSSELCSRGGAGKRRSKAPQKMKDGGDVTCPLDKDTCRRCGKTGHWA